MCSHKYRYVHMYTVIDTDMYIYIYSQRNIDIICRYVDVILKSPDT